jgi:hypothetical protein
VNSKQARELLQHVYFDSIASGNIARAVTALHPEVQWSHQRVWNHQDGDVPEYVSSQTEVARVLNGRRSTIEGLEYDVTDCVVDDDKGGFLGVVGIEGETKFPFIGWIEIERAMIRRYVVRPF